MRALIVGAGEMGQWFVEVTRDWLDVTILDDDVERARRVAERHQGAISSPNDVEPAPLVVTAVPMEVTESVIAEYGQYVKTAMIDLSGAMVGPLEAMREDAPEREHISLHPLFAPENAPGNIPMVVENGNDVAERLVSILEEAGYTPFETTADAHDQAMENVQAKVHAAVMAYSLAADPVDERFHTPVSAGMDELQELVLDGNPRVYSDIQARYAGSRSVAEAAEKIAQVDQEGFEQLYRNASRKRSSE